MNTYKVRWTQTLYGEYEIEANSPEEVENIALYESEYDPQEVIDNDIEVELMEV